MSPEITRTNEAPQVSGLDELKQKLVNAPVFAFLEKFDRWISKKERALRLGEVLLEPGENPYLYIVAAGVLTIYRVNGSGESQEVGKVLTGEFIGEGILSGRNQKDIRAVSLFDHTRVIALTKEDIEQYERQDPETLAKIYRHINNITSLRLAQSGRELGIMYEATQKFQEFRENGTQ
jgi:CRP-like cAMP-binding protein